MVSQPHPPHHPLQRLHISGDNPCLTDEKRHRYSQTRSSQAQTQAHWRYRSVPFPTMVPKASGCGLHPFLKTPTQPC